MTNEQYPYVTPSAWQGAETLIFRVALNPDFCIQVKAATKEQALQIAVDSYKHHEHVKAILS